MVADWGAVRDEATQHLRDLIRIDTTNPPGNETPAMEFLAGILKREGIEPLILESAPHRGNLVARLKGDGSAAPLLLMAHLDVVPAEADRWAHPPFSGDLADGYLWGRGALDTKDLAAMELMVMLLLKREGKTLRRDIIFMTNGDEEMGGSMGAGWMVKEHPALIQSEYAINEGGGFALDILGKRFFTVQVAEKGSARFILRTRGHPGHASMPHPDNAVMKLAEGVHRVGVAQLPLHATPTVSSFFEGIAENVDARHRSDVAGLLDSKKFSGALSRLSLDGLAPMFYAMLHNTVVPTILTAGSKINVIPSVAEARCDARILPGQTADSFLRELRAVLDNEFQIEFITSTTGFASEHQTPLFNTISTVLSRHHPNAPVLPYMVVGATDARHVRKLGTKVYGFCPMVLAATEMDRVHGHDERVSIENLGFGTRVLHEVVSEFCSS